MSQRRVWEELAAWGLGDLSPAKMAAVLGDLAEQLRNLDPAAIARHDVRPAAAELHDALEAALEAVEPLNLYDTHRVDARHLAGKLAFVVDGLRWKVSQRDDVDLVRLGVYEDELRAQTGATT